MSLLLHIIVTYIKENIITKLQKLYSPPRNPRAGNKSPILFVNKPLCTGDLLPARKIFIKRPAHYIFQRDLVERMAQQIKALELESEDSWFKLRQVLGWAWEPNHFTRLPVTFGSNQQKTQRLKLSLQGCSFENKDLKQRGDC